jgi:hypothetical protein
LDPIALQFIRSIQLQLFHLIQTYHEGSGGPITIREIEAGLWFSSRLVIKKRYHVLGGVTGKTRAIHPPKQATVFFIKVTQAAKKRKKQQPRFFQVI